MLFGTVNYGLQLLYAIMNRKEDWACERARKASQRLPISPFSPSPDMRCRYCGGSVNQLQ